MLEVYRSSEDKMKKSKPGLMYQKQKTAPGRNLYSHNNKDDKLGGGRGGVGEGEVAFLVRVLLK